MKKLGAKLMSFGIIFAFVAAIAFLLFQKPRPQAEDEIMNRSRKYVAAFGGKPLDQLSRDQRLILMHSYYNLKDYISVVRVGKDYAAVIDELPEERKEPFIRMFENSYAKLSPRERAFLLESEEGVA